MNQFGQDLNIILDPQQHQQADEHMGHNDFIELNDLVGPHELDAADFEQLQDMLNPVIHNNAPAAPLPHFPDIDLNLAALEDDSDLTVTTISDSDSSHGSVQHVM